MDTAKERKILRSRRKRRIRSKIAGTARCPRMSVYRSNKNIRVQLINDEKRVTLLSAESEGKNSEAAKRLGSMIAEEAKKKKIHTVVFDRGGYKYHGVVKLLADAAREGGLSF